MLAEPCARSAAAWRYARRQPLGLHPGTLYKTIHEPYFFGYVDQQLVQHYGQRLVESGGLRVRTTIDPELQQLAEQTIAQHLPRTRRSGERARRDRPAQREGASDGGLGPERRAAPVQPRNPGPPPGRQRLQAVHARGSARARHVALQLLQRAARADDPRPALRGRLQPALGRPQQRRRDGGNDEPDRRDRELRQHDLRAARLPGRPRRSRPDGASPRDRVEPEAGLLDHARHAGGQPARDDDRLRDASPIAASGTTRRRSSPSAPRTASLLPYPVRSRTSPSRSRSPTRSPTRSRPSPRRGPAPARRSAGRSPARPAPPRTTSTPGSAATSPSSSPASGSATPTASSR